MNIHWTLIDQGARIKTPKPQNPKTPKPLFGKIKLNDCYRNNECFPLWCDRFIQGWSLPYKWCIGSHLRLFSLRIPLTLEYLYTLHKYTWIQWNNVEKHKCQIRCWNSVASIERSEIKNCWIFQNRSSGYAI